MGSATGVWIRQPGTRLLRTPAVDPLRRSAFRALRPSVAAPACAGHDFNTAEYSIMEQNKRSRGGSGAWPPSPRKLIAALAVAGTAALPVAVQAAALETCGASLFNGFTSPTPAAPRFVGDILRIQANIGNVTTGATYRIDPTTGHGFHYLLDCQQGQQWSNCVDDGTVLTYVGNPPTTNCVDGGGNPVTWIGAANGTNQVDFTPSATVVLADPAVNFAGSQCWIRFDVQVAGLSNDSTKYLVNGADDIDGECTDGVTTLSGSAQGSVQSTLADCGITLKKEVSTNNGADWFDAPTNSTPGAPDLALGGTALYRLTVTNTGKTDPTINGGVTAMSSVLINDSALGISNAQVGPINDASPHVITSSTIAELEAVGRCVERGYLENVSNANGTCRATAPAVNATALDNAWVRCIGTPHIALKKEITIDGGTTWFDANDAGSAPTAVFPHGAEYRLTVTNDGTAPLTNITVSDPTLGISAVSVPGTLNPGDSTTVGSGTIAALSVATRCSNSGTFTNTASTTGASVDTGEQVTASDPAVLKCVGTPHISLRKQISVDGGNTWADADAAGDPDVPQVTFPHGALYQLIVKNDGTSPLNNVQVSDPDLGIPATTITDLAVSQEVIIGSGQIAALSVATRCNSSGTFVNTASVSATSTETGAGVNASNPAVLVCVGTPNIALVKEVSVDGKLVTDPTKVWYDANTVGTAPPAVVFPHGADYRITVENIGTAPLTNVVVTDPTLGVNYTIGNMAAGAKVVLTSGQIAALSVATRCDKAGDFGNTAAVTGKSAETGAPVNASDPAFMVCVGTPHIHIQKQISVNGGTTWLDADTSATAPTVVYPSGAMYRFVVTNDGNTPLINVTVQDPVLGIPATPISDLAVGQTVTIGGGTIAALNVATACDHAGEFTNTAEVDAVYAATGAVVTDSNPAVLECIGQDQCLTRTPGFWGTHPEVTIQYLPITVCGKPIDVTSAGTNHSSAEAMCVSGVDAKSATPASNMNYLQLVRQLTAAKLNVAASAAGGGTCDVVGGVNIDALIARCEAAALCGDSGAKGGKLITASGCIDQIDAFNQDANTTLAPFGPFVSPGPASPAACQTANGNGIIVR
jgi:uncharacterized repeat protein (TIGR01451 family)